jgi:hypothetical protein
MPVTFANVGPTAESALGHVSCPIGRSRDTRRRDYVKSASRVEVTALSPESCRSTGGG